MIKSYSLAGCRAVIFKPGIPLKDWLAKQTVKPFALINASLYDSDPIKPIGTLIENGKMVEPNQGNGFGFGVLKDGSHAFGGPWDGHNWKDYLTGFTGIVQNGEYVRPAFKSPYVFDCALSRIAIGELKNGELTIAVDDAVTIYDFGLRGVQAGFKSLANLDGGGSRFLYYDGKTIYTSKRTPYNAIAFYKDEAPKQEEEKPVSVVKTDKPLVCLDPGHGGTDKANGAGDYKEHIFTLSIGKLLKAELERCGVDILMTREEDKTVSLAERAQMANDANADYFISLHSNAYSTETPRGLCVYTATYANGRAIDLAQRVIQQMEAAKVITFGSKLYKQNFYVLKNTHMPSILIEHGFHTNTAERKQLSDPKYQKTMAIATAKAVCAQLGIKYISESTDVKPEGYDAWLKCWEYHEKHK